MGKVATSPPDVSGVPNGQHNDQLKNGQLICLWAYIVVHVTREKTWHTNVHVVTNAALLAMANKPSMLWQKKSLPSP